MPSLDELITEVRTTAPSDEPLVLLETAALSAQRLGELSDAMLSHYVDRARRAGHSWAEIGGALGVTKQAVQKRFTVERAEPAGWDRYTERAKRLVQEHVPAAAESLGHSWIGTEHLLLGFYAEPEALAPRSSRVSVWTAIRSSPGSARASTPNGRAGARSRRAHGQRSRPRRGRR